MGVVLCLNLNLDIIATVLVDDNGGDHLQVHVHVRVSDYVNDYVNVHESNQSRSLRLIKWC